MLRILITLFLFLLFVIEFSAQTMTTGSVRGSLFDSNGAVILETHVIVAKPGFQESVFPDPATGQFTFNLTPGVYTITTKEDVYFAIRRAVFQVKENETIILNLRPTLRVLSVALEVTKRGLRDQVTYNYVPKYMDFLPFRDSPLNVVIEYRTKKSKGTSSEYKNAKLTYNDLSINADLLKFDDKTLSIDAIGNVTKDENGRQEKSEKLRLQIMKPNLR